LSQHITRKELKKDAVREGIVHGAEAVWSHQKTLAWIVVALLVGGVAFFGWKFYTDRQTVKASAAFDSAMKVFQARVHAPGEPADPGEPAYFSDQTKYQDASQKFSAVALTYPHTRPGLFAKYYAALSLERLDKNDDARKWLQGLERVSDSEIAALARFELAQLDQRTGNGDEAVKLYQQLMANPAVLVPKSLVMMTLADCYSTTKPAEAVKLYKQVKDEFPDTQASNQADQQIQALGGKS
jgi:predicted negative regulator of RcsB-dependent stress response